MSPMSVGAMNPPQLPTQPSKQHTPQRAKVACRRCNARRVRCDVSQSQPCGNCQTHGAACEILSSRRGKYPRAPSKKKTSPRVQNGTLNSSSLSPTHAASPVNFPVPTGDAHDRSHTQLAPIGDSPNGADDGDQDGVPGEEGSEMLFARMTDASPEQEMSEPYRDSGRTFYLGEAFSLAFVVKTVCSPSGDTTEGKVHYPIPMSVGANAHNVFDDRSLGTEEMAMLQARGAYDLPPKHVGERLLLAFFESFYPAYPVFDRREIVALYQRGQLSFLVLQTIFYIAATVCDEGLLQETGFANRYQARSTYYRRAKALYDVDDEKDKVKLTSVLFLLGFWWQGPEDQKDTWFWLGAAISLAQTLGLHRSTARSGLSPAHRSLWKRIWWSIYVRDRHAAAALGRPMRIHDDDCDVEPLDESDFDFEETDFPHIASTQRRYHTLYVIQMSKLAILLGRILRTEFSASRRSDPKEPEILAQDLISWEQQIPTELAFGPLDSTLNAAFWARMLYASFNNCQILLHRPRCVGVDTPAAAARDSIARAAADATTRIAEDLLSAGTVRYAQLHLVPALFAALSVHSIVIRRRDPVPSQLAENRSRQCMLALSELSKSWPVGGWILQLFINLMKRLTGHDFGFQKTASSSRQPNMEESLVNKAQDARRTRGVMTPNGLDKGQADELRTHTQMADNQEFIIAAQAPDFTAQALWQYGEDLLPTDIFFQDSFGTLPMFDEQY